MSSIADNLLKVKGNLPSDVCLVAVSKFHPLEAVLEAYAAGQRVFGESRPQELAAKQSAVAALHLSEPIRWHFIGHLQTNKLKLVLPYASMVESVDSVELLTAIERWAAAHPGSCRDKVNVLLEIHIATEQSKQGFTPEEASALLTGPALWPHIRFCGLMGMATFTDDKDVIRSDFQKLTSLFAALSPRRGECPNLTEDFREMSFGMSEDYPIAVEMGATMVRIGTAIFGTRSLTASVL